MDKVRELLNNDPIRWLLILVILLFSMYLIATGNTESNIAIGWVDGILLYFLGVQVKNGTRPESDD